MSRQTEDSKLNRDKVIRKNAEMNEEELKEYGGGSDAATNVMSSSLDRIGDYDYSRGETDFLQFHRLK